MRFGVTVIAALAALLPASGIVRAQAPSPGPPQSAPGFVSTYEIVHTLRAAGFDPLAPPLREGTIYVARATDYRGILMRVVLDARTGAIRDANRIVPGPGNYAGPYGPYSEADDPYGGPLYGPGPYGPPVADDPDDDDGPPSYGRVGSIPSPYAGQGGRPPLIGAPASPPAHVMTGSGGPPLPRPRPPELAARRQADIARPANVAKPAATAGPKPAAADSPKPDVKASAPPASAPPAAPSNAAPATAAPATAAAAATSPPAARKPPSTLTINN